MHEFVTFTLIGVGTGAMYALCALGVVAIYRGSRTLNLAAGGIALWGALGYNWLLADQGITKWLALALVVAGGAVFGALVYLVAIRPVRQATELKRLVLTIGVYAALVGAAERVFPNPPTLIPSQFSLELTHIPLLDQDVGQNRLVLLAIAVVTTAVLAFWSSRSRLALATRAMAENERGAQALGASPHVLGALNWALGCALAAASGALVAPIIGLNTISLTAIVIYAFAAALVGRFDSFWLALVGGLVLGIGQSLTTNYSFRVFPAGYEIGWATAVPLVLVLVVLLLRRDRASNRLPAVQAFPVAAGRVAPIPAALAFGGMVVFILLASVQWLDAIVVTLVYAILALSLVVLIGYANQISLAQMAIAGLGAFVAAQVVGDWGVPFVVAPLVGAVAGGICGFLVGLPALRIRGVNLAIVTLALGLAISEVLFNNAKYTGGLDGVTVPKPSVFGMDVNAATETRRYAFFALFWLVVAVAVVLGVRNSKLGRQLLGMRTNERAATSLGISVRRAKLTAFVISSMLAGMAGVLLSFRSTTMTFGSYSFNASIDLVVVAVVAGVGSVTGGLVGGVIALGGLVWFAVRELNIAFIDENYAVIFGVALVITILAHPNGIAWTHRMQRDRTPLKPGAATRREPATLVVDDVRVAFGGVVAVDGVTFRVDPGTIVGLVGPNGAGKSTVLDSVNGFARAERGEYRVGDQRFGNLAPYRRARLGLARVFQGVELFEDLTVAANLRAAAESAADETQLPDLALDAIERLGLQDDLLEPPTGLPLAKRKFVAIVRALAANPTVLLLDEPGAGLSLTEGQALADELRHLAKECGLGVLLIDHDIGLVLSSCDRILVLQNGRTLAEGTPDEISGRADVRAVFLGDEVHVEDATPEDVLVPDARPPATDEAQ